GLNWFETASQMVFANDGAFNPWIAAYLSGDLQTVALSIARNIVAAFSRGIANCNNVTMASGQPPSFCANVTKSSAIIPMAASASDAYWSNEANWYPANGVQDYYAQYLHTARLDRQGNIVPGPCPPAGCFNTFLIPNNAIPNGIANSNQGIPMGMAYGFGYDENPVYVSGPVQVPSKLDPIPTAYGTGLSRRRHRRLQRRRDERHPLVQHNERPNRDVADQWRHDHRWRLARFGGKPVDDCRNRRFQWRWDERHPLVQHQHRASPGVADQRYDGDRRWVAWLGHKPLAAPRHGRRLMPAAVAIAPKSRLHPATCPAAKHHSRP